LCKVETGYRMLVQPSRRFERVPIIFGSRLGGPFYASMRHYSSHDRPHLAWQRITRLSGNRQTVAAGQCWPRQIQKILCKVETGYRMLVQPSRRFERVPILFIPRSTTPSMAKNYKAFREQADRCSEVQLRAAPSCGQGKSRKYCVR
jgi:hypothetical protein